MSRRHMRDKTKYASELNRWVDESCGDEFYFGNVEGYAFKKHTRILRLFESKHPHEELTPGQEDTFPILAELLRRGESDYEVGPGSGLYVIEGIYPFSDGALVTRWGGSEEHYDPDRLRRLVECGA